MFKTLSFFFFHSFPKFCCFTFCRCFSVHKNMQIKTYSLKILLESVFRMTSDFHIWFEFSEMPIYGTVKVVCQIFFCVWMLPRDLKVIFFAKKSHYVSNFLNFVRLFVSSFFIHLLHRLIWIDACAEA